MKKLTYFAIISLSVMILYSCGSKPNYKVALKADVDSVGYYLGYYQSVSMRGLADEVNIDAIAKGWAEGRVAPDSVLQESMQKAQMYLNQYFQTAQIRQGEKALKEGQDFLEANKKKQGIVTMPSGLQYRIIKEGTGIKPAKEDNVDVVYHGTLTDGTVFDSSKERQDTVTFPVGGVVPGFSEALTLMPEGSIWEVFIPSELGYGENPRGGKIKANSVLIFELNLVKVTPQTPQTPQK
ncbi:MAG: FKBP-type peptidyl-prolyl cis-trans isomerase [Bacteroidales bacterium]|jgi:FKBP-type peptidyl-prolyl cis-trans isomerase|nr:FKBP-type peptidyl-prolyl cis-trans isomerase [Bacteroidales bacterium]